VSKHEDDRDGREADASETATGTEETGPEAESAPGTDADGDPARDGEERAEGEDELSEEIREELEELERLRERHLRLAAEYDNFRKRTRREMAEARERAQADLVTRLLDALDDLQRVLDTPADATTVEALHEGVEMVGRKLGKELREAGLEPIEAEGRPFDPHLHEALLTTPVTDPEQDGLVSRVLVTGYRFGDRVIRPARVEVMTHRPSDGEVEGGDD